MREIGLYVHIPYCIKKCKYCDFVSFKLNRVDDYFYALEKNILDIESILKLNGIGDINDVVIDTIYIGGGTPSSVDSKYIVRILNIIKNKFKVKDNAEITIEVNPGTVCKKKLEDYYNAGINRLSIGLESTLNKTLKSIGRIHTYEDFLDTYFLAKDVGFKNINVDLMEALPGQTLKDLENSLTEVIKLNPTHISLYSLILEEKTELYSEVKKGKISLPDDETERDMYHISQKILNKNGYIQYEISNFSKRNFYSKHNLNCWKQHEYLGFGISSHSYINDVRFSCELGLTDFIDIVFSKEYNKIVKINEIQTKEDKMKEFAMLGLRTIKGVDLEEFEKKFNANFKEHFKCEIKNLKEKELIDINSKRMFLTKKGLDFANIAFMEFV